VTPGFVNIVKNKYSWAVGLWVRGKQRNLRAIGWMQNFLDEIHGWSMAIITRGVG